MSWSFPSESRLRTRHALRALLPCAWLALCVPAEAGPGHDHGEEETASAAASTDGGGRVVVELASELYEAVVESHGDHLDIWLDRFETNEPVLGAKVGLVLGDGPELVAAEETPGQYMTPIKPLPPGTAVAVTLNIRAAAGDDLLGGTLEVPADDAHGPGAHLIEWLAAHWRGLALAALLLAAGAAALLIRRHRRRADGFAASVCLAASLALLYAAAPPEARAHEGHDHAEEAPPPAALAVGGRPQRLADGSVFVPKPTQRILELRTAFATAGSSALAARLAGEVVGDPRASAALQTLQGGRVAGEGGSWPVLGARVRRGQALLRITASGSGSERAATAADAARAGAELAQAQTELARLEDLEGVVARAEIESQRARVASLRAAVAALRAPLAAGGEAIVAPIDGVIAAIAARPGSIVAPGEDLLTVIDPARLSVEALAFEPVDAAAVTRASVALRDGSSLEARLVGIGAQSRGGALPVRLDLARAAPGLVVGQPVTVFLERASGTPGLHLPVGAVVRLPSGERIVYEKVGAERFAPRTVRVQAVSADRVAVLAGLEPGARVVVRGSALIAQIR